MRADSDNAAGAAAAIVDAGVEQLASRLPGCSALARIGHELTEFSFPKADRAP